MTTRLAAYQGGGVLLALEDGRLVEGVGPVPADLLLQVVELGEAAGLGVGGGLGVADLDDVRRAGLREGGGELLLDAVPFLGLDVQLGTGLLFELRLDRLGPTRRIRAIHEPDGQTLGLGTIGTRILVTAAGSTGRNTHQHGRDTCRRYEPTLHSTLLKDRMWSLMV
ncbi:hypothetical protein GCM10020000_26840 [Streptomyces olivoverticillatus]